MKLSRPSIATRVDEFERQLREVAWTIARQVVAEEIARRRGSSAVRARVQARSTQLALPFTDGDVDASATGGAALALAARPPAVAPGAVLVEPRSATAPAATASQTPVPSDTNGRRRRWTRERIVDELAGWILTMHGVDAASISRRGGAALVNAARREFGRFEAALNAANLVLAHRFPDGVPKPGARA